MGDFRVVHENRRHASSLKEFGKTLALFLHDHRTAADRKRVDLHAAGLLVGRVDEVKTPFKPANSVRMKTLARKQRNVLVNDVEFGIEIDPNAKQSLFLLARNQFPTDGNPLSILTPPDNYHLSTEVQNIVGRREPWNVRSY